MLIVKRFYSKIIALAIVIMLLGLWLYPSYAQGPFEYVSPRPQADLVSAGTTIAVRHGGPIDPNSVSNAVFTVLGRQSGLQAGQTILADDGKTVIFQPNSSFIPSEVVTVTIAPNLLALETSVGDTNVLSTSLVYTFTVSPNPLNQTRQARRSDYGADEQASSSTEARQSTFLRQTTPNYMTLPESFPPISITVPAQNTAEGYIFMVNLTRPSPNPYLLMVDDLGDPVFYRALTPGMRFRDFRLQPNGYLTYFDSPQGVYQALDKTYRPVVTYQAGNGYETDFRGLQVNEAGYSLVQIYDEQPVDMSQLVAGGNRMATVVGAVVQELDPSGNVIFQWRSWDHFEILDASDNEDFTAVEVDPTHINSVEWMEDGNILISNRHMDEITKIDRRTADIIWRLGGKRNEFTFINEERAFSYQHDARQLPNGNITLYDNGNTSEPQYSRAVEYALDEVNKTATKVWEYRHQPDDIYGYATGGVQRLPNENTLIAWGGVGAGPLLPVFTEVTSQGNIALEMHFTDNASSYRVFRYPWQGSPLDPPSLVLNTQAITPSLHYSWNGATDITSWRVYGGHTLTPETLIDTQLKTRFETITVLTSLHSGCYFYRALPIDLANEERIVSNLIFTGDLSCDLVTAIPSTAALTKMLPSRQIKPNVTTTLMIPPQAISDTQQVSETQHLSGTIILIYTDHLATHYPLPAGFFSTGMIFDLSAQQNGRLQTAFTFHKPITLHLKYDAANLVGLDEMSLTAYRWDLDQQAWRPQNLGIVAHDINNQQLTVTTTHLSQFAIFARKPPPVQRNLVQDGGFEGGGNGSAWQEGSRNGLDVICNEDCGYENSPHGGQYWAFFGGSSQREHAYVQQSLTSLPEGQLISATLTFWLRMTQSSLQGTDRFTVSLNNTVIFTTTDTAQDNFKHYAPVSLDVRSQLGQNQILRLEALMQQGSRTSFFVDDVALTVEGYFVSHDIYLPLVLRQNATLEQRQSRLKELEKNNLNESQPNTVATRTQQRPLPQENLFMANQVIFTDADTIIPVDLPPFSVTVATDEVGEGYIFLSPNERRINGTPYSPALLIIDNTGELIYYQIFPSTVADFKKHPNGLLSHTGGGTSGRKLLNRAYEVVDIIYAAKGYHIDFHDFQILPDGHYLLFIYEEREIDMSQIVEGGVSNATVVGCRIQELDANKNLVFEWSSFDHIPITDTVASLQDEEGSYIDYVHCNALEKDTDGHILLSSRHLNEVTKIDRTTGDVIWRLGGNANQFRLDNQIGAEDVDFIHLHDIRRLPNDHITLFDNRTDVSTYSRASEYHLDEVNKVATLVWEHRNTPDTYTWVMANAQRLPNGNTLIGWGDGEPVVTEVKSDGTKVFELYLRADMASYRAFRFPWVGQPLTPPTLLVKTENPTITLTYSWNGATEVDAYRIYGDKTSRLDSGTGSLGSAVWPTTLIAVQPKTGFETRTIITDLVDGPYTFRIEPLDQNGKSLCPCRLYLPLVLK